MLPSSYFSSPHGNYKKSQALLYEFNSLFRSYSCIDNLCNHWYDKIQILALTTYCNIVLLWSTNSEEPIYIYNQCIKFIYRTLWKWYIFSCVDLIQVTGEILANLFRWFYFVHKKYCCANCSQNLSIGSTRYIWQKDDGVVYKFTMGNI